MGIFARVIDSAATLAANTPLGGLLSGLVPEHAAANDDIDASGASRPLAATSVPAVDGADGTRTVAFTIGVIALSAKMAKADGQVTAPEIVAFREVFSVPEDDVRAVGRVFDQARKSTAGFEAYARQLAKMFADRPAILQELLSCLFHIAKADGAIHDSERAYLAEVARIFGFDEIAFDRIYRLETGESGVDPYTVLGVPETADFDEVRRAYRRLAQASHPDRLIADGMPEAMVILAQERMAAINAAYAAIEAARGGREATDTP